MRNLFLFIALLLGIETQAQQIIVKKIFQYPNVPTPPTSYLLVMDSGNGSLFNISLDQLHTLFGTNIDNITVTNFNATFITNFLEFTTNLYATTEFVTNLYATTEIVTNLFVTTEVVTNLYVTNLFALNGDFINNVNGNGTNTTNWGVSSFQEIDAAAFYPTNFYTGKTNSPLLSTDGDGKIQNGSPLAATNVTFIAGANLTFTTNVDGSIVIASSGTITITTVTNSTFVNTNVFISTSNSFFNLVYVTNLYSDTFTNNTFVNTNTVIITGKASVNTLIVTNVAIYGNLTNTVATPSTVAAYDSNRLLTNLPNAHGVLTNTASGPASFGLLQNTELQNSSITIQGSAVALGGSTLAVASTPNFNAINITNSPYIMGTNNGGGNALVSGSPGVAATMYLTNITADTTLAAATFWNAGGSVIPVLVTCSGGANKQLKFPANWLGAGDLYGVDLQGTGTTITNAEGKWFELRCIYGVKTNVFQSATK